jgi:hypothetical protein
MSYPPPQQPYGQQPYPGQPYPQQGYPQQSYPQQPYADQRYPQQPYPETWPQQDGARHGHREAPPRRRKHRVFLWVFLAIQVLFVIWIIAGLASKPSGPTAAQQAAQYCSNGGWSPLFKSYSDCVQHYGGALNDAANTGKGIGVALIIALWVAVDVILGIGYGVYRLATRR